MDPVGHLVEYIDKNRVWLGIVQSSKKNRLGILTSSDRQAALAQGRVLLFTPAAISPERPRDALAAYMSQVEARREKLAREVDVEGLWELVHSEDEPLPLVDLAELQFGAPAEDDHLGAVLRALFYERLHFRLTGGAFVPLSREQLEKKILQRQQEELRRREVDQAVAWLKAMKDGARPDDPPPPGLLDLLSSLVIFEDEAPQAKKAKEIASLAELGGRRRLFKLLVRLGVFSPHENLPMLREGLSEGFGEDILEQAARVDPASALGGGREDLSELFTFTIDGQFTTDFDDALSFEPDERGGGVLGVHITDVAALLPGGDPLDLEAKARGATIYLPETRAPMLPPSLSEEALSLRQGEPRPAVSTLIRLDAEGQVLDYRIVRSLLKVHQRLTYDQADEMLADDGRLTTLHRIALALRRRRGLAGAYFLPLPELIVGVDQDFQVHVRRMDRDGPSREMVAETAIAANQLAARFLAENDAPALFRTQAPPREPIEEGDPSNLFLHFRQRRLLNRVEISTKPGLHSSLGVKPYIHVTSPIRRYLDLVMQRQLGSVLAGQGPMFTAEELEQVVMEVQPAVRQGSRVRQARQRYWLLRWLEARRDQPQAGLVMERQTRRWQILLTDIMMLTSIPVSKGLVLEPGREVALKIEKVDAFNDQLRVGLA